MDIPPMMQFTPMQAPQLQQRGGGMMEALSGLGTQMIQKYQQRRAAKQQPRPHTNNFPQPHQQAQVDMPDHRGF